MEKLKFKMSKRCPRCNMKTPIENVVCPGCKLNYEKFNTATNAEAKQAIKEGNADQVLMRTGRPKDVKFIKLLLIAIFLGAFGGHNYYVGRYKRGILFTVFFFVGIINGVVNTILKVKPHGDLWEVFTLLVMIWGLVLLLWVFDIVKICLNRFKIPVSKT